jgi:hypothetical protein
MGTGRGSRSARSGFRAGLARMVFAVLAAGCAPDDPFDSPCDREYSGFSLCACNNPCPGNATCSDNLADSKAECSCPAEGGWCIADELCCTSGEICCQSGGKCCAGGMLCFNGECCRPLCEGRECGPDGCGNANGCGTCSGSDLCQGGSCVPPG